MLLRTGLIALSLAIITVLFYWYNYSQIAGATNTYAMYQDIHVMTFVGVGFLCAFLKRNSNTAIASALFLAAFSVLWGTINFPFWRRNLNQSLTNTWSMSERFNVCITNLAQADFCAFAVLISFGAVVGRASTTQLFVMAFVEVIAYSINEAINNEVFFVADFGGSMTIHLFGALFGIAASFFLEFRPSRKYHAEQDKAPEVTQDSNTLAMIGTLFLFCFFPSFNAFATSSLSLVVQQRAVINTVLAICASVVATFALSPLCNQGRFHMREVQGATLAGGIAMGAPAATVTNLYGAVIIGMVAGACATLAHAFLEPVLAKKLTVRDTASVLSFFGVPGLVGGIASVVLAGASTRDNYLAEGTALNLVYRGAATRDAFTLAWNQFAVFGVSIGIAVLVGSLTGLLMTALEDLDTFFDDSVEYHA